MIRASATTQKLYIDELNKSSVAIKRMNIVEGDSALKQLELKGNRIEQIINSLNKTPEEELFFMQQSRTINSILLAIAGNQLSSSQKSNSGWLYSNNGLWQL